MRWLLVAAVVLAAGAARADDLPTANTAPKPWELGQWVAYRHTRAGKVSREYTAVVARDACGLWIEHAESGADSPHQWLLCFRADVALPKDLGEARADLLVVVDELGVHDLRHGAAHPQATDYDWILVELFPAPAGTQSVIGDVSVPAGHFPNAARIGTTWSDFSVPFTGLVERTDPDDHVVLVARGDCCAHSVIPEIESSLRGPPKLSRLFLAGGAGFDWQHGGSLAASKQVMWTARDGIRVTNSLDLVVQVHSGDGGEADVGLRWRFGWPQGHRTLFTSLGFGDAFYDRTSATGAQLHYGTGSLGGALGLLMMDWRGVGVGLELSDHVFLDGPMLGTRNDFGASMFVEVHLLKARGWP